MRNHKLQYIKKTVLSSESTYCWSSAAKSTDLRRLYRETL